MSSPKLVKKNPSLVCLLNMSVTEIPTKPSIKVEFFDGNIWETYTDTLKYTELRAELYEKAEDVEELIERSGIYCLL